MDEARVLDALQIIQDYCEEQQDCSICCLETKQGDCAFEYHKRPDAWKLWVEVKL